MAHRILVGNRATGGYGLYVSKSGADVLDCVKGELSFWTDHGESGNAFVSKGMAQTVPTSLLNGVPVESGSVTVSANVTASSSWLNLGEDVMVMGASKKQLDGDGFEEDNILSSITATGANFTSVVGRTFNFVIWKTLGKGATLY
tara:strand:+ start:1242 stop:1676 length:435 start_codon:yes stop_codon:yes gene_type:complete